MHRILILGLYFHLIWQSSQAAVQSDWRGPRRDGHYPESDLAQEWPNTGPRVIWHASGLGKGFTSAAVTENRVFVTGQKNQDGFLSAFDHGGKILWQAKYGEEWSANYEGTRSTPIVADGFIYFLSGRGVIYCLSAQNGEIIWQVDILKRFKAPAVDWGIAEQLLVDGDVIYCTPGGAVSMAALNRRNGKTIWTCRGNGEPSAYCSPILVDHHGKRLLITLLQKSAVGVDALTGTLLWRYPHEAPFDIHANTPIYADGRVYIQSGEGGTGVLLNIAPDAKQVTKVWEQRHMDTLLGHAVLVNGFLYGAGFPDRGFQALNWQTGASEFEEPEFTRSAVIFADGLIYAYSEKGTLALIKPNPSRFDLISSFKISAGNGPHWAHPVIKDRRLYLRHGDELIVFDVSS